MKIYKYQIDPTGIDFLISVDEGATLLSIQTQNNIAVMWFQIDTSKPLVLRTFTVKLTGFEFDGTNLIYCGTFQLDNGEFVGHLYEKFD